MPPSCAKRALEDRVTSRRHEVVGGLGIEAGSYVSVLEGRFFPSFSAGDKGWVIRVSHDAMNCDVLFEGRTQAVSVSLRHLLRTAAPASTPAMVTAASVLDTSREMLSPQATFGPTCDTYALTPGAQQLSPDRPAAKPACEHLGPPEARMNGFMQSDSFTFNAASAARQVALPLAAVRPAPPAAAETTTASPPSSPSQRAVAAVRWLKEKITGSASHTPREGQTSPVPMWPNGNGMDVLHQQEATNGHMHSQETSTNFTTSFHNVSQELDSLVAGMQAQTEAINGLRTDAQHAADYIRGTPRDGSKALESPELAFTATRNLATPLELASSFAGPKESEAVSAPETAPSEATECWTPRGTPQVGHAQEPLEYRMARLEERHRAEVQSLRSALKDALAFGRAQEARARALEAQVSRLCEAAAAAGTQLPAEDRQPVGFVNSVSPSAVRRRPLSAERTAANGPSLTPTRSSGRLERLALNASSVQKGADGPVALLSEASGRRGNTANLGAASPGIDYKMPSMGSRTVPVAPVEPVTVSLQATPRTMRRAHSAAAPVRRPSVSGAGAMTPNSVVRIVRQSSQPPGQQRSASPAAVYTRSDSVPRLSNGLGRESMGAHTPRTAPLARAALAGAGAPALNAGSLAGTLPAPMAGMWTPPVPGMSGFSVSASAAPAQVPFVGHAAASPAPMTFGALAPPQPLTQPSFFTPQLMQSPPVFTR
eukprot:TRINITY_DN16679_c0_g1_i1.p1 TRINITY_DN16679_c0_g1~~TRINITY_DN16679_c0_g1_i1.p1  ORF type:complete len:714 (+),score=134.24 TRINITY_DN16679_c0_g1_i1:86-2227(+)